MRKRVLSFLLAASAAFCFICSSAPEAQAIVPIGFVQSALASYVSSTGYKLYNDNGTGQDILDSLGELYDDYVTIADKTITGQLANLAFLANSPYIYQDNSGQIVVSKVAADIFQDFADWIQTEYNVPVGSDTPSQVLAPASGGYTLSSGPSISGVTYPLHFTSGSVFHWKQSGSGFNAYWTFVSSSPCFGMYFYNASGRSIAFFCSSEQVSFNSGNGSSSYPSLTPSYTSWESGTYNGKSVYYTYINPAYSFESADFAVNDVNGISGIQSNYIVLAYNILYGDVQSSPGVVGLGVTLAQAVTDVVGQAKEDDAVVIGVGASAGATAQDIADMVAQGVKAQTLDPSVSITAEAVIDTPVQPYPDIDGLGLPTLGAALVDRFPFCIPWDFVDTVKLLSADPQPINIKVDLIPQRIKTSVGITSDTSFDIDLSGEQYAKIGVFCRWGSLITFCFGLFLLTKRLVWTA